MCTTYAHLGALIAFIASVWEEFGHITDKPIDMQDQMPEDSVTVTAMGLTLHTTTP